MGLTVEIEGVAARYGRRRALHDVSVPVLTGGTLVGLIGPNAAGKSTLLRRIAGIVPGPGRVRVDGREVGRMSPRERNHLIAYLPQETTVSAVLTVFESVLLARKQTSSWRVGDDDVEQVAATLALLDIAELAGRRLDELSGGQRQLVSIAQVVARAPALLLLDEPTSALDLQRQVEVLDLMRRLSSERGMCIVMAIHDLNLAARFADRLIVMSEGRLAAFGAPGEILDGAMLQRVYGVECRVERCSAAQPMILPVRSVRRPPPAAVQAAE